MPDGDERGGDAAVEQDHSPLLPLPVDARRSTRAQEYLVYPLFYAFLVFLTPRSLHGGDAVSWVDWASAISVHGLGNVYERAHGCNYMPLYPYLLTAFAWLQGSPAEIARSIHTLKALLLVFDFLTVWAVLRLARVGGRHLHYAALLLLNPAFLYNTLVWGQIDSMFTFPLVAAVYYALADRPFPALLFVLLALNVKPLALVFVPLVVLVALPAAIREWNTRRVFFAFLALVGAQALIFAPFIAAGQVHRMLQVVTESVDRYPSVSFGAFNLWTFFFRDTWHESDAGTAIGLTYKHWGVAFFALAYALAALPLAVQAREILRGARERFDDSSVVLAGMVVSLAFFFFNTRMHERYNHPAIALAAAYAFLTGRYFPYVAVSAACFLNLEKILHYLQLRSYGAFIFSPRFVAALFATIIVYGVARLYAFGGTSRTTFDTATRPSDGSGSMRSSSTRS